MNKPILLIILFLIPFRLFCEQDLKRSDEPEILHRAAMENLELQAKAWEELEQKERNLINKELYGRVKESYRTLILLREEKFIAEKDEKPFHYEKFQEHKHKHNAVLQEATDLYGKGAPVLPKEVRPKKAPVIEAPPTPLPEKSYTTESGFEVKFRLEE